MRIISPFRDFYDVVAGQGVDLTRVFKRSPSYVDGNFPLPGWAERQSFYDYKDNEYPRAEKGHYGIYPSKVLDYLYVLFAGKLYGGVIYNYRNMSTVETKTFWDIDKFADFVIEEQLFTPKPLGYKYLKYESNELDRFNKVFSIRGDEYLRDWAIENNLFIAAASSLFKSNNKQQYIINPTLSQYDFQKVLDPFTAYQELEQWLSGVLGNKEVIPEMSDKDKIKAHGFSEWSFRKHKLDNK